MKRCWIHDVLDEYFNDVNNAVVIWKFDEKIIFCKYWDEIGLHESWKEHVLPNFGPSRIPRQLPGSRLPILSVIFFLPFLLVHRSWVCQSNYVIHEFSISFCVIPWKSNKEKKKRNTSGHGSKIKDERSERKEVGRRVRLFIWFRAPLLLFLFAGSFLIEVHRGQQISRKSSRERVKQRWNDRSSNSRIITIIVFTNN